MSPAYSVISWVLIFSPDAKPASEGTYERLRTEALEHGDPLYVVISFRWVADPPPYLDPGPGTKSLAEKRKSP